MTIGNLVQIEAKGPEDYILYGNPQVTYFQQVYKRSVNFAIDIFKIPENHFNGIDLGSTIKFKVPFRGDLLGGIYLKVQHKDLKRTVAFIDNYDDYDVDLSGTNFDDAYDPRFTSYVNGIGFNEIEYAKIYLNGVEFEHLNGEVIFLNNELHNSYNRKKEFYKLTRFYPEEFRIGYTNQRDVLTYLHIPFFFTKDPSTYLPLCSLRNTEIQVEIRFKPLEQCLVRQFNYSGDTLPGVNGTLNSTTPNGIVPAQYERFMESVTGGIEFIELYMKSVYVEKDEQTRILKETKEILIETLNVGTVERLMEPNGNKEYTFALDFYNPTKYIYWVIQREDVYNANQYDNFTNNFRICYGDGIYSYDQEDHLLKESILLGNNVELIPVNDAIFLSSLQLYESFRAGTDYNIYIYNFALNPCSSSPMGTLNFSKLLHKELRLKLVDSSRYTDNGNRSSILVRTYSHSFNMIIIKDGLAGLLYQN